MITVLIAILGTSSVANADTKAYEFTGKWIEQPETVRSGHDVLSAAWYFDVIDDRPAPSNNDTTDNLLALTVTNGYFTEIPGVCLGDQTSR